MKKVLILLLLFIVACGGSVRKLQFKTLQLLLLKILQLTIPPAPISDINYVELYNSKLGTELCSDAKR